MTTHLYYKTALAIARTKELECMDAQERLDALYMLLAHAMEAEQKENDRLRQIYGPVYKDVFSVNTDRMDDLISEFRVDNHEELMRIEEEFANKSYEDAQAKVYH